MKLTKKSVKPQKRIQTNNQKPIVVGYGRKSKEDPNVKGNSLDNQKAECQKYAVEQGFDFVYFEDNNKSGFNLDRPNYKRMVEFIRNNSNIHCIVVWKLDRLTRNIEDYYGTIQPFIRENNTTIVSIQDNIDDSLNVDPIILALHLGVATQELKNTQLRTKAVMKFRAENGFFLGKAPVGYINTRDEDKRGIIIPDSNNARYIKKAFELYATGIFSLSGVGLELSKYGFVNSLNKPYPKKRIEDILKNPVYMGKVLYNGQLFDGKHKPIISEELFYRVQLRFSNTANRKPKGDVKTYTGFIECAKCGCAYTGLVKHGAHNSGTYTYYRCSNYYKTHTKEKNISEYCIDQAMQEVLDSFDISNEHLNKIKKSVFQAIQELQNFEKNSIGELNKQYKKITDTISNAVQKKVLGELEIDNDTYKELMAKWEAEKREIGNKIKNISASTKDTVSRINILADFANRIPELYLKASLEEKRMILSTITEKILIDADEGTITVKLRPVFEKLRLTKLLLKRNSKNLDGTHENQSYTQLQSNENLFSNKREFVNYGTRTNLLNTKIEPNFNGSTNLNVEDGT